MPRPSHRLDLLLVPVAPDLPLATLEEVFDAWVSLGILRASGEPGAHGDRLVEGGFGRVVIDRSPGGRLYGNQAGGFRAACGDCGAPVVTSLLQAVREGRVSVQCTSCSVEQHLNQLRFMPPAAWGLGCLWIRDAATGRLGDAMEEVVPDAWGEWRLVYRRP